MAIGGTFGRRLARSGSARSIWARLQEGERVNRETGETRYLLAEEERLCQAAGADAVPVYRTVSYGQEP